MSIPPFEEHMKSDLVIKSLLIGSTGINTVVRKAKSEETLRRPINDIATERLVFFL